ncbi:UPF0101 protein CGI-137, putative [Eimeria necatrix]|uniref:Adenylate kinase isoenzyme 6 homolog n=1 Tax=Eimeria necatrix TaxID=51315 RepID=U6MZZ6_9EIME|nr:UPF0101 protein CGI-137, putative [Eimeria necatrix]CDJ67280.1 UPF0101 protein CGI-137, putative [Eimeria necatrix]
MARKPNILVTGTPGVGKSSLSAQLAQELGLEHLNVGELIKSECLYTAWDSELDCSVFDEELLGQRLFELLGAPGAPGGLVVDFHSCCCMQKSWFSLVFVLRANTEVLYDRLQARLYPQAKIQQNLQAEIFQVLFDEATEAFGAPKVRQLPSNDMQDFAQNLNTIKRAYHQLLQTQDSPK